MSEFSSLRKFFGSEGYMATVAFIREREQLLIESLVAESCDIKSREIRGAIKELRSLRQMMMMPASHDNEEFE